MDLGHALLNRIFQSQEKGHILRGKQPVSGFVEPAWLACRYVYSQNYLPAIDFSATGIVLRGKGK